MDNRKLRLLLFNLMTDAADSNLGFTTDWINALAEHCEYIDVVTMQAGRLALADNVRVYSVGKEKGYGEGRRALEFYRLLFRLLRGWRYDVCFAHMMPLFAVMGAPLLKLWRVPIVLWYTHKAVSFKLRLAEKVAWRVVTASPESFRIPSRKTRVIGHGVDTNLFTPPAAPREGDSFVTVTVGRIAPVKNLDTLIDAAAAIMQDGFRLRVIGEAAPRDEDYEKRLHEQVATLNLKEVVEFSGALPHERIVEVYQNADVMVNTSKTGSIDKAVLEAMACALPVITSNEAFRAMLAPWGDLLAVPSDSPDQVAASLVLIKKMLPEKRLTLGRDLREIVVREHSLERLITKLICVFKTGEPV
jgi:glycosyltransferase involved in cell wall biosynthesis